MFRFFSAYGFVGIPFLEMQVTSGQFFPGNTEVSHQNILEEKCGRHHWQSLHDFQISTAPGSVDIKVQNALFQIGGGNLGVEDRA